MILLMLTDNVNKIHFEVLKILKNSSENSNTFVTYSTTLCFTNKFLQKMQQKPQSLHRKLTPEYLATGLPGTEQAQESGKASCTHRHVGVNRARNVGSILGSTMCPINKADLLPSFF